MTTPFGRLRRRVRRPGAGWTLVAWQLVVATTVGGVLGGALLPGYLVALGVLQGSGTGDLDLVVLLGATFGILVGVPGGVLAGLATLPWRRGGAVPRARLVAALVAPVPAAVLAALLEERPWILLLGVAVAAAAGAAASPLWLGRRRASDPRPPVDRAAAGVVRPGR